MKYSVVDSEFYNYDDQFVIVEKKGKYGYFDKFGNQITPLKYDDARPFSEGLAATKLNGKWGFINEKGEEKIAFEYDNIEDHESWTLGDLSFKMEKSNNNKIWSFSQEHMTLFSEGLANIKLNGKCGFINKEGNLVIHFKYDKALFFTEGIAGVQRGDKWAFINTNGKELTEFKYDMVGPCFEGLAEVKIGEKWGFIDAGGNEIIPPRYGSVENFSEGLAVVYRNGKYGFINRAGHEVIPLQYDQARSFSEGLAFVQLERLKGNGSYIDKTGKEIFKSHFLDVGDFHNGLAKFEENNKWGFIDKEGQPVISPLYEEVSAFSENMAAVVITCSLKYGRRYRFINGEAFVDDYRNFYRIDRRGNVINYIVKRSLF